VTLTLAEQREFIALAEERDRRKRTNRLAAYEPYPKQAEFHRLGATHRERLLMAGNQLGKQQRFDEPVLTPTGWVEIGQIRPMDEVIAGDGSVTTVTNVYPQGVKPLVEMEFSDGQKVISGPEHLWKVLKPASRFKTSCKSLPRVIGAPRQSQQVENLSFDEWSVLTTEAMRKSYGDAPSPRCRYATPAVGAVALQSKQVALDPYFLGMLLGDGSLLRCIQFTTADASMTASFAHEVRRHGGSIRSARKYEHFATHCPSLLAEMRRLGLMGKGALDKHVPAEYLWNDAEVRLAVLQGLMDTDGTCEKSGVTTFTSISRQLADDVTFLARSFGAKCKTKTRTPSYTYKGEKRQGKLAYTVTIRLPHAPLFRLERKLGRYIRPTSTTDHNLVVAFRDVEPAEAFCIEVAHPDHTYVTRDFIVTHNTLAGGYEVAMHLTGRYPAWWQGLRYDAPVVWWVASETMEVSRDGAQRVLLGRGESRGEGAIPGDCIKQISRYPNVVDAVSQVTVNHVSGSNSLVIFKSYDQGRRKFQGDTINGIWFDEEPPEQIYTEGLTRTNAAFGPVMMTFTPLLGMSSVVLRFLEPGEDDAGAKDRTVVSMTIDDVDHYSPAERASIIASYPEHEREARTKGIPIMGSGRVFPIAEERIVFDPVHVQMQAHWPRIAGIDFGWDHPTAGAWLAWDRDADVVYVHDDYSQSEQTPVIHAAAFRAKGKDIPVAWPHDGLQHDKGSGEQLAAQYRAQGLAMLANRATFPDGSNGVEAGIMDMLDRMQTGRFKVSKSCTQWWREFRLYHRKDGLIVKLNDDVISASRYALMCLAQAKVAGNKVRKLNFTSEFARA